MMRITAGLVVLLIPCCLARAAGSPVAEAAQEP